MNNDKAHSNDDPPLKQPLTRRHFLQRSMAVTLGTAITPLSVSASDEKTSISVPRYERPLQKAKLRIGVVGGGFGLQFPWHEHPNCEVTAVADLFKDRREKMKKTFKCDNVYGEFHPMLKSGTVDAVAIYTYGNEHARHCIDVMKAGKHVMSVIPAAISLEECQSLIDTVNGTGQIYMYGETGCFHPGAMAARQLNKDGQFGKIYYTEGEYSHGDYNFVGEILDRYLQKNGRRTWRWGFPQGFYVGHATGAIVHATGDPFVKVSAVGMKYQDERFKENTYGNPFVNTTFFCQTASGVGSTIKVHWHTAAPGREGANFFGTDMCLFESGGDLPARICFPNESPTPLDLNPYSEALPPELRSVKGHGGSHSHIINEFVTACLQERPPYVDVRAAANMTAPGIVGFRSALREGEPLSVPTF